MKKPRFEQLHYWIIGLWFLALVLAVMYFLSVNEGYAAPFQDLVGPLAVAFLVAGTLVLVIAAGLARFIFAGRYARAAVLILIPALVVFWLALTSGVI